MSTGDTIKGVVASCMLCATHYAEVIVRAPDHEAFTAAYQALTVQFRAFPCQCGGRVTWSVGHTQPSKEVVEAMRGPNHHKPRTEFGGESAFPDHSH